MKYGDDKKIIMRHLNEKEMNTAEFCEMEQIVKDETSVMCNFAAPQNGKVHASVRKPSANPVL